MANRNKGDLLSTKAWDALHSEPKFLFDPNVWVNYSNNFTKGGICYFDYEGLLRKGGKDVSHFNKAMFKDRDGYYGWMGFGGSCFQWDPKYNISFAYVTTKL